MRQVPCRLARRTRSPPAQSLPHQKERAALSIQDAARGRNKKSPRLGSAREILEAYAEARPHDQHDSRAARELARLVGHCAPHQVTPLHLHSLVARWRQNYARNTCWSRTTALRRVMRFFEDTTGVRGLKNEIPRVPGPLQRHIIAKPDELDALHEHADPLERIWLRICVALALGTSEARTISPAHYNAEARTITFTRKKTGEPNTLPVPDDLAEIFERCPQSDDPAEPFLQRYNHGHPLTAKAISCRWLRLKKKAGVRAEITPHDLRRTTNTMLYDLTKDLRVCQQLLGHADMRSTVRYVARHEPSVLRPLLAQLWTPKTAMKQ